MYGRRAPRTQLGIQASLAAVLPLVVSLFGMVPARAQGAIDNWADFRKRLASCWQVPAGTEGSLIAFRFGLNKMGALRGKPLVTARRLTGDADAQKHFVEAATHALDNCLPMPVTPGFGAILGESPIRLRFINTKPSAAYQINSNITIFAPQP